MRVERIDIFHVSLPLVTPWRTAYGCDEHVGSVLIRMTSDKGVGWGESTPLAMPTYSPEYAAGVFRTVRDVMAPTLRGHHFETPGAIDDMLACFKGNPFAKAALDLASWDIHAQSEKQPLWRLIGGTRNTAEAGGDLGVADSLEQLIRQADALVEAGMRRIKLKFTRSWGLPAVEAIRRRHPSLMLHIDCNGTFTLRESDLFRQLDDLNLTMIEQPLAPDNLVDHATLQRVIRTPICLDETIKSPDLARQAIELGACRWINIKPGRVGGLTAALQIHALCAAHDIPCWIGSMLESGVGIAVLAALATLPAVKYPSDLFDVNQFFKSDLALRRLRFEGPMVFLPDEVGIGAAPDEGALRKLCVEQASVDLAQRMA